VSLVGKTLGEVLEARVLEVHGDLAEVAHFVQITSASVSRKRKQVQVTVARRGFPRGETMHLPFTWIRPEHLATGQSK
jgi:hypothetical protein